MKSNQTREVHEEVYQELLETERKYLLLLDFLQNLLNNVGEVKDNLNSFLRKD